MKETPILFSGDMVRAILSGAKTQTRRPVKYTPALGDPANWPADMTSKRLAAFGLSSCPYGEPGGRLWVRETFVTDYFDASERNARVGYRADWTSNAAEYVTEPKWKPSIHMPRWASRITLPVVAVRIERVQDITAEDAQAEGVTVPRCGCEVCSRGTAICPADATSCIEGFRDLWCATYGRASWEENPWVWVVEWSKAQVRQ